jgi:hypothetical protein
MEGLLIKLIMRLSKKTYPSFVLILLLLQGCYSGQRDMARFMVPRPEEEPPYREKAEEFVRYAQAGDVDKMLAITSTDSYATQSDSVRTVYAQQVVPQFAGSIVTWEPHGHGNIDEHNNAGLMFTGTARGTKTFTFDIIVMKEEGKLVVINIRKHR